MKTPWRCLLVLLLIGFTAGAAFGRQAGSNFVVGEFTFAPPAHWDWVEVASPMRKAQLRISESNSTGSADVVFFLFPHGSAGGVKANVDRWLRQFSEPREAINAKIEEATMGKTKVTYVSAEGTFNSGMPGGPLTPMPDSALMGAILESEGGDVFVKMTGPKKLVKASVTNFKKMVADAAKK